MTCLSLLPAAASRAATAPRPEGRPVPADAPVVATTPSGHAVIAWVVGGRTCTVLQAPGAARPTALLDDLVDPGPGRDERPNGHCETTPVLSQFHAESLRTQTLSASTTLVWGVAGPSAARVETRRGGTVQASSATATGPLSGPAAGLRFWALEQPADAEAPDEVAVLDASGTVRRAFPPDNFSLDPEYVGRLDPTSEGALLRRGRTGTGAWELRQTVDDQLQPTPLQPERRIEIRCLELSFTARNGSLASRSDEGPCDESPFRAGPLQVSQGVNCDVGTSLVVLARAPARSAVVVLGDGRRQKVALTATGGPGQARAGATFADPTMAVRRVEGLGADGRVVQTWPIGMPPLRRGASGCAIGSFSVDVVAGLLFDQLYYDYGARPYTPHVVDFGAEICVAINRAPRVPLACGTPPVDPEAAAVGVSDVPGGQHLYGLVPVEVAAARVTFADRTTQTVPATPIPGYAGQYAGTTAQVALDVLAPRRARSAVLLDADGRVLGRSHRLEALAIAIGRETALRPAADGLPALRATVVTATGPKGTYRTACVGVDRVTSIFTSCGLALPTRTSPATTVEVSSRCTPRRLLVLATLRRATDRLVVRLRGGGEVVARNYHVPAAMGLGSDHHVALAVLGPHDAVVGLRVRGRAARRIEASYPAAADQCGYIDVLM